MKGLQSKLINQKISGGPGKFLGKNQTIVTVQYPAGPLLKLIVSRSKTNDYCYGISCLYVGTGE